MADASVGVYTRQLGFFDPSRHENAKATFVGVGGIGSFAAYSAAKLGLPKLVLIDPDIVEEHNQPNQYFSVNDCGELKVDALDGYIRGEDLGQSVETFAARITEHGWEFSDDEGGYEAPDLSGLVISGLDSMQARKDLWQQIRLNPHITRYMDARLSGEFMVVYTVNPTDLDDCDTYEEQALFDDDEGEDISCTERGIIDVGLMMSAVLTRSIRRHFNGDELDAITMVNHASLAITKGGWVGD